MSEIPGLFLPELDAAQPAVVPVRLVRYPCPGLRW
jgi:hypothetical protein